MWQVHHEEILECHALQMNVAFLNQAKQKSKKIFVIEWYLNTNSKFTFSPQKAQGPLFMCWFVGVVPFNM